LVVKAPVRIVVPAKAAPARNASTAPGVPKPDGSVSTLTYSPEAMAGLKVKFKSMEDLKSLTRSLHVDVLLEYTDGQRFRIPRDLGSTTKVFAVTPKAFDQWVADGRVTELVPTRELMDRLNVHVAGVRYLAVLDGDLRDAISTNVERAQVRPGSIVTVARGPVVSVNGD